MEESSPSQIPVVFKSVNFIKNQQRNFVETLNQSNGNKKANIFLDLEGPIAKLRGTEKSSEDSPKTKRFRKNDNFDKVDNSGEDTYRILKQENTPTSSPSKTPKLLNEIKFSEKINSSTNPNANLKNPQNPAHPSKNPNLLSNHSNQLNKSNPESEPNQSNPESKSNPVSQSNPGKAARAGLIPNTSPLDPSKLPLSSNEDLNFSNFSQNFKIYTFRFFKTNLAGSR